MIVKVPTPEIAGLNSLLITPGPENCVPLIISSRSLKSILGSDKQRRNSVGTSIDGDSSTSISISSIAIQPVTGSTYSYVAA